MISWTHYETKCPVLFRGKIFYDTQQGTYHLKTLVSKAEKNVHTLYVEYIYIIKETYTRKHRILRILK